MILETERLILRPWSDEDAEDLFTYASDPRVGPAAGWRAHTSLEESREILRRVLQAPGTFAVCLKEDCRAIGDITIKRGDATDLTDLGDEAEIGFWLGVPFWGNGYIPEAVTEIQRYCFEELGLEKLWCAYYDGNEKSRRAQEKCGFIYHHTTEGLYLPQMDETRTGHVNSLSRRQWESFRTNQSTC